MKSQAPRLMVEELSIDYEARSAGPRRSWDRSVRARVRAVERVSLALGAGETLSLVGESGCGKSSLGRAVLRLEEPQAGRVLYRSHPTAEPVDLLTLPSKALRTLRRELGIVLQDPLASLNPRQQVDRAIGEVLQVHEGLRGSDLRAATERLMDEVGLDGGLGQSLPQELSGGQRQRVALARTLATHPSLIVCDEITASLDVTIQARVLELLLRLQETRGLSYLFITHDLGVVQALGGRVAVMYLGRIVETGTVEELFARPRHPYTVAMLHAAGMGREEQAGQPPLAGEPPSPVDPPEGCVFHPRCPLAEPACCAGEPAEVRLSATHRAACRLVEPD